MARHGCKVIPMWSCHGVDRVWFSGAWVIEWNRQTGGKWKPWTETINGWEWLNSKKGRWIDVGNLIWWQGTVKMMMSIGTTCALMSKSLCWGVACQKGSKPQGRKGGFEKLASTSKWAATLMRSSRELWKQHCHRCRGECTHSSLEGESELETSFDLLTRLHHQSRLSVNSDNIWSIFSFLIDSRKIVEQIECAFWSRVDVSLAYKLIESWDLVLFISESQVLSATDMQCFLN